MKLRRPCEHGVYDEHWVLMGDSIPARKCPGGVFLPDDTLVIEKVDGKWPRSIVDVAATAIEKQWARNKYAPTLIAVAALDALSVRDDHE